MKFLVQICKDLHLPEERDYADKLKKLEKINQLRVQRETESGYGNRRPMSTQSTGAMLTPGQENSRPTSSRRSLRNASATAILHDPTSSLYQAKKKEISNPSCHLL